MQPERQSTIDDGVLNCKVEVAAAEVATAAVDGVALM